MSEKDVVKRDAVPLEGQKLVFGRLFLISNKLQVAGDAVLAGEMTASQWLLTAAIARFEDCSPTLGEVAALTGNSRQNVKQLALKLQKEGFVDITADGRDKRAIRLMLTSKCLDFWGNKQEDIKQFLSELFKDISEGEIDLLCECMNKLYKSLSKRDKHIKN